ncbi:uncharacterized protein DUF4136 [Alteromonadaceae bacterium 2753L.S.0a.02]|nr:uncharacterized protein DUF4136 [Alteromonadaceae bacterium 2753L.S.0a.02]
MNKLLYTSLLVGFCLLTACSNNDTSIDYRTDYDFSKLKTFHMLPVDDSVYQNPKVSEIEVARIGKLMKQELAKRYTESTEDNADFMVRYFLVLEDRMKVENYNASFGMYRGGYGYHYGIQSPQIKNTYYQQGSVIVDILEPESHDVIWRGSTEGRVKDQLSPEQRDERVSGYLMRLFDKFPPR